MNLNKKFEGSPWNSEPSADWNLPSHWSRYYRKLLSATSQSWKVDRIVYRGCNSLLQTFSEIRNVARRGSRLRILDAGCGIAVVPNILAYWGCHVTAIDSCPQAISVSSGYQPVDSQLARCIDIWEPVPNTEYQYTLINDPLRSLHDLNQFKSPGGEVDFLLSDWHDTVRLNGKFDVIYCRNSLRQSTKQYWRESLNRFRELLVAGGVLVLETSNAIGIQSEVIELLDDAGFHEFDDTIQPDKIYAIASWPTG